MFNKYYTLGGAARDNTNQPKYQVVFWLSVLNAIIEMACVIEWSMTSPWAFSAGCFHLSLLSTTTSAAVGGALWGAPGYTAGM